MLGWMLFVLFFVYGIAGEGVIATLTGLLSALGIDFLVAVATGEALSAIFTGVGLADDVVMLAFSKDLGYLEKVALGIFLAESQHVTTEAYEWYDHTDEENRRFSQYLQRFDPGVTYLFGDVTPRDLFDLGASAGYLVSKGTFSSLLDAAKEKFGGLVTPTAEVIAIGGGV